MLSLTGDDNKDATSSGVGSGSGLTMPEADIEESTWEGVEVVKEGRGSTSPIVEGPALALPADGVHEGSAFEGFCILGVLAGGLPDEDGVEREEVSDPGFCLELEVWLVPFHFMTPLEFLLFFLFLDCPISQ